MRIMPFNYPLDDRLIKKLDLLIARIKQKRPIKDAVLLVEGEEGTGKTTMSVACAYYIAQQTGRAFDASHLYFRVDHLIKYLQRNDDCIAIWDEPALQGMSKDFNTKVARDLDRLLSMARKKRHFLIINMNYFSKYSDYLVWQRPHGMIHIYERHTGKYTSQRFTWIRKKYLELLMRDWRSKKRRNYRIYGSRKVRGTFPPILDSAYKNNVLSHFDNKLYEDNKDKAIMSIGEIANEKVNAQKEVRKLKYKLSCLMYPIEKKEYLVRQLGYKENNIFMWAKRYKKDADDWENPEIHHSPETDINKMGDRG